MVDMMDFFNRASKGQGADQFAKAFDLTPEQSARAVEAMLPVIVAMLQRQMSDPKAAASWLKLMAVMPQQKTVIPAAATEAMARLTGSPEIADAIAEQISASSGVGQAVARAMLPWATAIMVGGLAAANARPGTGITQASDAMKPVLATIPNPVGPKSFADDTFGAFVRGYVRGRPEQAPEPELTEAEKLLQQMLDAGRQAQAAQMQAIESLLDGWTGKK
jgi:hypothetical protein